PAHFVGVRDMHGGTEIVVDRLHLRECEGILRYELRVRKGLRNERKDRRRFGQGATVRHQRRHPPFRIDRKILRGGLLAVLEVETLCRVGGAGLFQGDVGSQRAGAGGGIELEHVDPHGGNRRLAAPLSSVHPRSVEAPLRYTQATCRLAAASAFTLRAAEAPPGYRR